MRWPDCWTITLQRSRLPNPAAGAAPWLFFDLYIHLVRAGLMKRNGLLTFWVVLSCLWLAMVGYLAHDKISPFYVKKKVTVTINGAGAVAFIFSDGQPHNEIIYEMKSDWVPRLEAAPADYVGKVITTPYETYLTTHVVKLVGVYLIAAIVPIVGVAAFGRVLARRRKRVARAGL